MGLEVLSRGKQASDGSKVEWTDGLPHPLATVMGYFPHPGGHCFSECLLMKVILLVFWTCQAEMPGVVISTPPETIGVVMST